ncbi:MAG: helix-turn-helix domain-containing protein [Kofleriaceae bacterium]|jgi:excisionase family DNA binding protein|nr:helix-turn-helix domain-containing protein [Kofleriaceae bacterium]
MPPRRRSAPERDLSPRQVAEAIGVSESSVKRWCDDGAIPTRKTAGGHRRIPIADVVVFLRAQGFDPARPDLLGLPAGAHRDATRALRDVADRLGTALRAGAAADARALLTGLYLAGQPLTRIGDEVIGPVMAGLGHAWSIGQLEVYQEHHAVEIVRAALFDLGGLIAVPAAGPVALLASLEGDPYSLAIGLGELILRERGWRAIGLGAGHPAATLVAAVTERQPRLLALSVGHVPDRARLIADVAALHAATRAAGAALALGGRAIDDDLRATLRCSAHCASLAALADFADSLPVKAAAAKKRARPR